MNTLFREVNESDIDNITTAIDYYKEKVLPNHPKEWIKDVDYEYVLFLIKQKAVSAVIIQETYLLLFDIYAPWYSLDELIFAERMLLRINNSNYVPFKCVVEVMEILAKEAGANVLVAGTALARKDEVLGKLYMKEGYTTHSIAFEKRI